MRRRGREDDRSRRDRTRTTSMRRERSVHDRARAGSAAVSATHKARTAQFVMPSRTEGSADPGLPRWVGPGGPDRRRQGAGRCLDPRVHRQRVDDRAAGEGQHPEHDQPARNQRQRESGAKRSWFVPTAKHWVNVENGNILRTMLKRILTNQIHDQAGGGARQRQHHVHAESEVESPSGTWISLTSSQAPRRNNGRRRDRNASVSAAPSADPEPCAVRRSRICSSFRSPSSSGPILGYPLYKLVTLSFQQYGLPELIQSKGRGSASTTTSPSSATRSSGTCCYAP